MKNRAQCTFLTCVILLLLPLDSYPKGGADGFIILKGTIQEAETSEDAVSFLFTGQFSFTFYSATEGDPAREQIDQRFNVTGLPVRIPKFGENPSQSGNNPLIVNFRNAATHAAQASRTGEPVTVAVFRPIVSYDTHGVMVMLGCTHAQVMPDRGTRY